MTREQQDKLLQQVSDLRAVLESLVDYIPHTTGGKLGAIRRAAVAALAKAKVKP